MEHVGPVEHLRDLRRQLLPFRRDRSLVQRDARRVSQQVVGDELELALVEHRTRRSRIHPERFVEFGVPVIESVEKRIDAGELTAENPIVGGGQIGLIVKRSGTRSGRPGSRTTAY